MLKNIPGERIRRQYFNSAIYLLLMFPAPFIALFFTVGSTDPTPDGETALYFVFSLLLIVIHLLIPLVVLSILNRYCFGKVICVLNERGLYYFDQRICFIAWNDIQSATYDPSLPELFPRHRICNTVHITAVPYKKPVTVTIDKAPFHLLRRMKKHHPKGKYRLKPGWIIFAVAFVVFTSTAGIISGLMG